MGKRKGVFSRKGVSETAWGKKTRNLTVTLSEEGWLAVKARAKELGISFSEITERWGRKFQVDSDDSIPIPEELDFNKTAKEMTTMELHEALGEKLEIQQNFLDSLLDGTLTDENVAELTGLLDLEDSKADRLIQIAKLFRLGGKKTNGV
jgi:hypothetical protein